MIRAALFVLATFTACPAQPDWPDKGATPAPVDMLPADAQYVMSLDFVQLRKSWAWPMIDKLITEEANFDRFEKECGFSPFDRWTKLWMSVVEKGSEPMVDMVVWGASQKRWQACSQKAGLEVVGNELRGDGFTMRFLKEDKFVFSARNPSITWQMAKGQGVGKTQRFASLVGHVDKTAAVWLVAPNIPKRVGEIDELPFAATVSSVTGFLSLNDGVAFNVRVECASAEQANQVLTLVGQLVDQAKLASALLPPEAMSAIKKTTFTSKGSFVEVSSLLTEQEVKTLIQTLQ